MKLISKIIFLFSICKIITACGIANPASADDCKDDTLLQTEKDDDYVHCCFVEAEKSNIKYCKVLTSYQFKNIGKYIKRFEEDYDYDYKVDCNSSFLQVCLIVILTIILL